MNASSSADEHHFFYFVGLINVYEMIQITCGEWLVVCVPVPMHINVRILYNCLGKHYSSNHLYCESLAKWKCHTNNRQYIFILVSCARKCVYIRKTNNIILMHELMKATVKYPLLRKHFYFSRHRKWCGRHVTHDYFT